MYSSALTSSYFFAVGELTEVQVGYLGGNQAADSALFLGQQARDARDTCVRTMSSSKGIVDVGVGNRSKALGKRLDVRFFVLKYCDRKNIDLTIVWKNVSTHRRNQGTNTSTSWKIDKHAPNKK